MASARFLRFLTKRKGVLEEFFLIAESKSVYNSEGYISVESYSDFPERFYRLKKVFIHIFGVFKEFEVEDVLQSGRGFIIRFRNFNDAEEAEILCGKKIYIKENELVRPGSDTYFIHDLIGSNVVDNTRKIGSIVDVLTLPANDVYVVKQNEDNEILIPAIADYIDRFDKEQRILFIRNGSGLTEDAEN